MSHEIERDYHDLMESAIRQAQRILGDRHAAEDVAAEAVGRLLAGSKREHFKLIVHGLTVDAYRRLKRELPVEPRTALPGLEEAGADVLMHGRPATLEDVEFRVAFDQVLRALPEMERDAFILTELRGLTERDAAAVLGVHQSTVHRRAEAARNFIREEIA